MKKEMEADDESFESYSTCFEERLKAALREMQIGQSFSCSSNTNSKKKNDDDVMNNNNETTTTEDKEDKEDNKEEEEKKRITQTRKEIIEKHILRDARRENDEALEKKLLTATTTTTLALYKENATVADAFLMAAGKITSALIEAYEDFLDDSSSSQCALADFISDALLRGDDKGKDKSKKSSSSNSKINDAKSSTYRAFLEVLLLVAESEELKDTQLRLLPFRFIEDVFAQSSVEDCSDIVNKYLFSENFIPKENQGYEDGDYYPHDIDGIKYPEEKTGKKRVKSKTKLIQKDVYDRLIVIMDIKKEFDENGLRKMKSASEIYNQTGPEKYDSSRHSI